MSIYILTMISLLGITVVAKAYYLLTRNLQQRTIKGETWDVILNIGFVLWGIMLLLN